MTGKSINIWKWLFFILIGAILFFFLILFFLVSTSKEDTDEEQAPVSDNDEFQEYFSVQLTRTQLNQLLNEQIEAENVDINFGENNARITSGFQFMGRSIEAEMEFEPQALEDGNIALVQRNVSLGNFSLPGSEVLALMDSQADLPDYVDIQSEQGQILISLDQLEVGDDYHIQADTFQLAQDDIELSVGK
ncbi:DUF2140 family protein [Salibacterium salarium]|uniref:DUF2140 family protein n=1 Tax=Salibacterium salarium TaxID=284579 RepID=A0A428MTP6_9BACI|nr:YpmS family protein [Salibacterium salarium]RSL29498.1 DUF2140 family protein [Salibacterium salarium]